MAEETATQTDAQQHTMQEAADRAAGVWQDDFKDEELTIPYKREEKDAGNTDDSATTDKGDGTAGGEDVADAEVQEVYTDPAPIVTVEDPGDYTPADYSFEVTLKDGKTVKVSTPEDAEKLADDPDNFETPKQLMDFINKQNKMNRNLDRDHDKWEAQKKTFDEQNATEQQRQQTVDNLVKGFEYLTAKGMLPKVDAADLNADWNDPEIAKHDGVKEQIALLNYMVKENKARARAGVPELASALDAYNAWQLDTERKAAEKEHKQAGAARKAAGARVASVSPSGQGAYVPKGIAVGRVLPQRAAAMWED